jgi:2-amino-4-hydroxy-6-hydroxymethyldihydropteridine diphosphokinase
VGSLAKINDAPCVIALGANICGEWPSLQALLEAALEALARHDLKIVRRSSWWRSAAWPDPTGPEYRNGVALVDTTLDPLSTLQALRRIERDFGRERSAANAPRTLDLDLIDHAGAVLETPGLVLPHPRAADRLFVMGPLAEIAPEWRHPVSGRTAADLAALACVGRDAAPV